MKPFLIFFFLLLIKLTCFSQSKTKDSLQLFFYDNCLNQLIEPEFEILHDSINNFDFITIYKNIDQWTLQYSTSLYKKNDTLIIPKILFASENVLHSKNWVFMNCGKICNGIETDYYKNGNKRIEGTFKDGKPIEIREYWKSGNLYTQTFYDNLTLEIKRLDFFDKKGELEEYQKFKKKKRKSVIKTFDKNGKLTEKETRFFFIIK